MVRVNCLENSGAPLFVCLFVVFLLLPLFPLNVLAIWSWRFTMVKWLWNMYKWVPLHGSNGRVCFIASKYQLWTLFFLITFKNGTWVSCRIGIFCKLCSRSSSSRSTLWDLKAMQLFLIKYIVISCKSFDVLTRSIFQSHLWFLLALVFFTACFKLLWSVSVHAPKQVPSITSGASDIPV